MTLQELATKYTEHIPELARRQVALAQHKVALSSEYETQLANATNAAKAIVQVAAIVGYDAKVSSASGEYRSPRNATSNSVYNKDNAKFRERMRAIELSPCIVEFEENKRKRFILPIAYLDAESHTLMRETLEVQRYNTSSATTRGGFLFVEVQEIIERTVQDLPEVRLGIENGHIICATTDALAAAASVLRQLSAAETTQE